MRDLDPPRSATPSGKSSHRFCLNKPRGVPRVDDRRVLNGIFWRLRSGAPWADIPERYGPHTTCYNRFVRWRAAGIWDPHLAGGFRGQGRKIMIEDSKIVASGISRRHRGKSGRTLHGSSAKTRAKKHGSMCASLSKLSQISKTSLSTR